MQVTIRSEWLNVVVACLEMDALGSFKSKVRDEHNMLLVYRNDDLYREMSIWLGHALACGLILRGEIER